VAVGIDLGTTHSLVAACATAFPNAFRCAGTGDSSFVVRYLAGGGRQIGFEAQAAQSSDPENTIASVKRFMGRSLQDVAGPRQAALSLC